MTREDQLRQDIVEVGRRLYQRGYVASNDGNISVRIDGERILATPTGVSKGFMTPDMMVVTDLSGRKLAGPRHASSELKMHLAVYRLMQFTLRDILIRDFDVETADRIFYEAGKKAGEV